jgi:long-chain fatty acid transport protein
VGEKWVFGLGVFTPYGLGTEWPNDWAGQQLAVKTDLQTFYINPTVAYQINDKLSVGVGLSVVLGTVTLKQRTGSGTTAGTLTLDGSGNGVNFDLGVLYKPTDKLSVGASYRTLTSIEFSGSATFTNMGAVAPYFPGDPNGKATLPMPSNLFVGAAYKVGPRLTLEGDFQWVGWKSYDKLTLTIKDGPAFPLTGRPLQTGATLQKKWDDGFLFRLGGEYTVDDKLTLRAGYINDISPQPPSKSEPMLPDGDRNDFSIGGSYQINNKLHVDFAYMLVLFTERDAKTSSFPGKYNSSAHLISIEFGYQF